MYIDLIRRLTKCFIAFGLALCIQGAGAAELLKGPVPARVVRVVDGDTLLIRARIWLGQEVETRLRLANIDTPELKGRCERERKLALAARHFVIGKVGGGSVILRDIQYGKFAGRVLARLETATGEDVGAALLARNLGRPYKGGRRTSWCPDRP